MSSLKLTTLALALIAGGQFATAEDAMKGMDHSGTAMPASPALQAYMSAMDGMMASMNATHYTGEADADFLLLMIPHHQSAVDMSRALLEEGKDPEVKAFAESIIKAQEAEIAGMQAMLRRMGVEPPPLAAK